MARPQLVPWFKIVSALTVVFVLLQAFMAGRFLFAGSDLMQEHENGAYVALLSALFQTLLLLGIQGWRFTRLLAVNVLLVILIFVQISLGYSDSGTALAWHVANGTFLMGLSGFNLALALQLPRTPAAS